MGLFIAVPKKGFLGEIISLIGVGCGRGYGGTSNYPLTFLLKEKIMGLHTPQNKQLEPQSREDLVQMIF